MRKSKLLVHSDGGRKSSIMVESSLKHAKLGNDISPFSSERKKSSIRDKDNAGMSSIRFSNVPGTFTEKISLGEQMESPFSESKLPHELFMFDMDILGGSATFYPKFNIENVLKGLTFNIRKRSKRKTIKPQVQIN